MSLTNDDIISVILRHEGGDKFTQDPDDPGGATKYGITLGLLKEVQGDATVEQIKNLTEERARQIYMTEFIIKTKFNLINDMKLRHLLVDTAVNCGKSRTTKWFQFVLGLTPDGVFGPKTEKALLGMEVEKVYRKVAACRLVHYVDITDSNPKLLKFLRGWVARTTEFLEA